MSLLLNWGYPITRDYNITGEQWMLHCIISISPFLSGIKSSYVMLSLLLLILKYIVVKMPSESKVLFAAQRALIPCIRIATVKERLRCNPHWKCSE